MAKLNSMHMVMPFATVGSVTNQQISSNRHALVVLRDSSTVAISSPEAAILLVCARIALPDRWSRGAGSGDEIATVVDSG